MPEKAKAWWTPTQLAPAGRHSVCCTPNGQSAGTGTTATKAFACMLPVPAPCPVLRFRPGPSNNIPGRPAAGRCVHWPWLLLGTQMHKYVFVVQSIRAVHRCMHARAA